MSDSPPSNFTKSALRKQALSRRRQLPISAISEQICQRILGFEGFLSAPRIFFYYPINHELDLRPLVHLCPNKEWFLPVVRPEQKMHFASCSDLSHLEPGPYGIAEPKTQDDINYSVFPPDIRSDDCLIMPGLLFDRQGFRLGYGKGYFDRFIQAIGQAKKRCLLLGAVPADLLVDNLPRDPWDEPAHWIITEREVLGLPQSPDGESRGY